MFQKYIQAAMAQAVYDIPGFAGFPDEVRRAVATIVRQRMEGIGL